MGVVGGKLIEQYGCSGWLCSIYGFLGWASSSNLYTSYDMLMPNTCNLAQKWLNKAQFCLNYLNKFIEPIRNHTELMSRHMGL